MSLLVARDLHRSFGGVEAVRGASLSLEPGELLALIGPNGAGKSTCFNLLNGQLRPDRGSVTLDGTELVGLPPRRVWELGIARTFQITATFSSMTVAENVQMVLLSRAGWLFGLWRPAASCFRKDALEILARVGMADQADRPCAVLAYGDLKRVELAMALASEPKVLLMDEPTAGMAPGERMELMALTGSLVREQGLAVLFTEHDMDVVFGHATRILVLDRGSVIAQGTPETVRADPRVQAVYLGGES